MHQHPENAAWPPHHRPVCPGLLFGALPRAAAEARGWQVGVGFPELTHLHCRPTHSCPGAGSAHPSLWPGEGPALGPWQGVSGPGIPGLSPRGAAWSWAKGEWPFHLTVPGRGPQALPGQGRFPSVLTGHPASEVPDGLLRLPLTPHSAPPSSASPSTSLGQ